MKRIIKASKQNTQDLMSALPSSITRYAEYMPGVNRLAIDQDIDTVQNILEEQGGYIVDSYDSDGSRTTVYLHRGNVQIMLYSTGDFDESFIELVDANGGDSVYRIYFVDSNQKLLQGRNIAAIIKYIEESSQYAVDDIVKIENVDWYK